MHAAVLVEQEIVATMRVAGKKADTLRVIQDPQQEPPVRFRLVQASPGLIEHPLRHWIAS
jgi:4-diphosphocytidyl-2-C-methyl-D-erythritol kinase